MYELFYGCFEIFVNVVFLILIIYVNRIIVNNIFITMILLLKFLFNYIIGGPIIDKY